MDEPLRLAAAIRQACIEAALRTYEDAGYSGLCHEGRWACAVYAMRGLHLRTLLRSVYNRAQEPPA